MNVDRKHSNISGCFELIPKKFQDERGFLVKTYHQDTFGKLKLQTHFEEEFYSVSAEGVLRGMHFQLPPHDHVKIVSCLLGEIMDVVVDVRVGSPTYGAYEVFHLSSDRANMLYIPKGLAHGFYVSKGPALVLYKTSTIHAPNADGGIHWKSLGIPWPNPAPLISDKDDKLPPLHLFASPFSYTDE